MRWNKEGREKVSKLPLCNNFLFFYKYRGNAMSEKSATYRVQFEMKKSSEIVW